MKKKIVLIYAAGVFLYAGFLSRAKAGQHPHVPGPSKMEVLEIDLASGGIHSVPDG